MTSTKPIAVVPTLTMCGDSITQYAWMEGGTGAVLANLYQRKLDVVNRGLSGYNTAWSIPVVERWLPRVGSNQPPIAILTLFFGANDACLPHSPQYVPLDEFKTNLNYICNLITNPTSLFYSPTTQIILITPPPVDAIFRAKDLASRSPPQKPDREYERTHQYTLTVVEVGKERGIPVIDAWTLIAEAAKEDGGLESFLSDGLHLTGKAYGIITAEFIQIIEEQLPELHWSRLPECFPPWASIPLGSLGDKFKVQDYKIF